MRWGGKGREVRGRAKYMSDPSSHAAHRPHASQPTNQMEQSGEQPRKGKSKRSIARRVDHSLFATTSSKQQAAPGQAQVHTHVHVRVEVEVEVEASRGRESITNHRGGVEGKWINRSEQVGVDDMTRIIGMAKCGR